MAAANSTTSKPSLRSSRVAAERAHLLPVSGALAIAEEPIAGRQIGQAGQIGQAEQGGKGHPTYSLAQVSDANVEQAIEGKGIGERIRRLRLKRSMGLVELGKRTGMSASFLSQLETGRVVPTLRNLSRIALVFRKELTYFFVDEKKNQFRTSRGKDRIRLPIGDRSAPILISESMGALIPDRSLVPCIAEFLPHAGSVCFEPSQFSGHEFIYVMDGSLIVTTEGGRQELETADTAWIDGLSKRKYSCAGRNPARAMIISCRM